MSTHKEKSMPEDKDAKAQLEEALANRKTQKYVLRLYVSGMTAKSTRAIDNIRKICEEYLHGRYELEVIDIFKHPEQAKTEQVIAAPTLIKKLPLPLRRYIGDLSNSEKLLVGLEIKEESGS
jgi:circadian clock protein KaiB